jgi:hypothetical protein
MPQIDRSLNSLSGHNPHGCPSDSSRLERLVLQKSLILSYKNNVSGSRPCQDLSFCQRQGPPFGRLPLEFIGGKSAQSLSGLLIFHVPARMLMIWAIIPADFCTHIAKRPWDRRSVHTYRTQGCHFHPLPVSHSRGRLVHHKTTEMGRGSLRESRDIYYRPWL